MSKKANYTAYFDIRVNFTMPLFESTDPNIKFGNDATISFANMIGGCLKSIYESVTVNAGAAQIYLYDAYGSSTIQNLEKRKVGDKYLYSATFSAKLPASNVVISSFDRIDTDKDVREEIEEDLEEEFFDELSNMSVLLASDYSPEVVVKLENSHVA